MAIIPTIQQIAALADKARAGDANAYSELADLNNKLAKRANQRMSEIEKTKGIAHTDAYDRAQGYLENVADNSTRNKQGNMRFSQSRKLDVDDLEENLDNVGQFLRDETSKVSSEKMRRANEQFEALVERGYIEDLSESTRKQFFNFLKTDAWNEIKKREGTGFYKEARDLIASGLKVSDLKNLYNEYKSRYDIDFLQFKDAWVSGKKTFD